MSSLPDAFYDELEALEQIFEDEMRKAQIMGESFPIENYDTSKFTVQNNPYFIVCSIFLLFFYFFRDFLG